jgi:hypothetical protein
MSAGGAAANDLATLRGRDYPSVRQFSIFSPNRMGQLLNLSRLLESASLRICGLSINDTSDSAIIRLVVSEPERGYEVLQRGGYAFCEVDLLVVGLPDRDRPIHALCAALVSAEIDIHYSYPLLSHPFDGAAMAFHVSDLDMAAAVMKRCGYRLFNEADLEA